MTHTPATYISVDLVAIRHNVSRILERLKPDCLLCAVVKANAYGHGMGQVARACLEAGAARVAVSTTEEGVALREAGVTAPVLVFLPPLPEEVEAVVAVDLTATVTGTHHVMELQREAARQGKRVTAHAYEDLGLGRLAPTEAVLDIIETAEPWPEIRLEGWYAHFGPPGTGVNTSALEWMGAGATLKVYAAMMRESLGRVMDVPPMFHAAASGMFLEQPDHHFGMVRIGTLLYGQYPDHVPADLRTLDLRPTFELCSHILSVHTLPGGSKVGYGGEFICARETRVATVPVGLAHGLGMTPESVAGRLRSCAGSLLRSRAARRGRTDRLPCGTINGQRAPLIGRVSMDQCALDVTDVPEADRGTVVVLPVRRLAADSGIPRVYSGLDGPAGEA